jgi:hypothetical protein
LDDRNGYMLEGRLARRGYDWWWHSLVAVDRETGQAQPFFIAYFVINPALGGRTPVFGQLPENRARGLRPSYAMLKAGAWAPGNAVQIHNFYGIADFAVDARPWRVRIGPHELSRTRLRGAVRVTPEEAAAHPEYMSDAGELSWDLTAEKVLSYSVGYGASPLFRWLNAFEMYWHVAGMLTRYTGEIRWNGRLFDVRPETSAGYQDKNWGQDYTRLWVWLNCNRLVRRATGEPLPSTSLVVGGAEPVLWGLPLPRRLLVAVHHDGRLYEVNFSKLWTLPRQRMDCGPSEGAVRWRVEAWNRRVRIKIDFSCDRSHMQLFRYENPKGQRLHRRLWNGGWAHGTVELYDRGRGGERLIDVLDGTLGGCEYGEACRTTASAGDPDAELRDPR